MNTYHAVRIKPASGKKIKMLATELGYTSMVKFLEALAETPSKKLKCLNKLK